MMTSNFFFDNCPREFVPYKGYKKIQEDGTFVDDDLITTPEGPFMIVPDPISHGNWHTLYNLVDKEGNKILPKGIRKITYYEEGYYLLEDNNEDELINRGDVKGGFRAKDYHEYMNVMRTDGTLLSTDWFTKVIPDMGFFRVSHDSRCWKLVKISGEEIYYRRHELPFGCFIQQKSPNDFVVYNSLLSKLAEGYTSAIWNLRGVWGINILFEGKIHTYLHGEANAFLNYAHELLLRKNLILLLEKNGYWYYLDSMGNIVQCLKWEPNL